ncbi:hypothetical protein Fmac_009408 [Flemingia macrophylla]|uniref:TIR domain-containing protein n=1 Tax=Flemingia macrophylla TaxID=520843 RepID=A0ABD1N099_9FABA
MDEHQRISSNSSSIVSSKTYDVFLSFRGEDTRLNFTSHLYKVLNEKKIKTFIDDQLKKGDKISQALTKTIEDSHVSIIIFSKNYAFSKWCLDELSKIMECEKVQGQIVIPVFYNIEPSHVRKQTGSYKEAFAKHGGDYRCKKWRDDLTEAANISGCDSQKRNEEMIEMHDLIQEMGYEIIRQESIKYPKRRSRLWKHDEVVDVLKKNKENDIVEGIILNLELLNENLNLSNDFLAKMTNLRFFKIYNKYYWIKQEQFNIYLRDNLKSLSDKLRYFHWDGCCLESLSSKFCAEQLVVLIMRYSKLKKLWDRVQNLWNLKEIDLAESMRLTNIPDLSKATKLVRVNLRRCNKIKSLNIHSKYLSELYLDGCYSLAEISVTSDELTSLDLSRASLNPETLYPKSKLKSLNVNSRPLKELYLPHFSSLKQIAVVSDQITALKLRCSDIASLPSFISSLPRLTHLDLYYCCNLVSLPELPRSLRFICLDNCRNLMSLPELPSSLDSLTALNCNSLETEMCQRLALQHLLRRNSYGRGSKYLVFPGNHVIEECEFHTTEPSMSIPASCLNISHLCGFICCIILSKYVRSILGRGNHNLYPSGFYGNVDMSVSIYEDDTQLWHARKRRYALDEYPVLDHVMFGYHDLSNFDGMSEVLHPSKDVRIIFQSHGEHTYGKGFGVFPVYATTSGFELQISESQSIQPKQPLHQRGEGLNQKL